MSSPERLPKLPPALAPWTSLFADMPEPELRIVAALVEALWPLVERVAGAGAQPEGEIDGIDHLGTRGGIERLVASEWLWRDLDPELFLQRAAERDLLTLEPTYRQASETGAALVVVDAGPGLIGATRLVAFAALLCIGTLAQSRKSRLIWACTTTPDRNWREGIAPADAANLLKETAATILDAAELDRMLALPEAIREAAKSGGSLWLVGGRGLPLSPRAAHQVTITERLRLDPAGLQAAAGVKVTGATNGSASTQIDLPTEAEAAALLRDPFRPRLTPSIAGAKPSPAHASGSSGWAPTSLAFSPEGSHLLVARPDGILVIPTLGEGVALRLPMTRYRRLVGLDVTQGWIRTASITVYSEEARLIVRAGPLVPDAELRQRLDLRMPRDHPLAQVRFPAAALPPLGALRRRDRCWFCAADGKAFVATPDGISSYSALKGGQLLTVGPAALLTRDRVGAILVRHRSDGRVSARFPAGAAPPERVDRLDVLAEGVRSILASHWDDGTWRLSSSWRSKPEVFHLGKRIVGFANLGWQLDGDLAERPTALCYEPQIAGMASLTFRDIDGTTRHDPLLLPDRSLDVVRIGAHPKAGPCIAAARLDADGFVESLLMASLTGNYRHIPDVGAFAEAALCLRV